MYVLQQTAEWKDRYRIRSGIEGTNPELKRAHGIGRLRVRRLVKVCFAVACKVIACNIKRWAKAVMATLKRGLGDCFSSLCARATQSFGLIREFLSLEWSIAETAATD
jgi:hypothetical protein